MPQREYPYLARTASRTGWVHEFWQYDGHYIVKTWATGTGGNRHYDGSERYDGTAPVEDKPVPARAKRKGVEIDGDAAYERHRDAYLSSEHYRDWVDRGGIIRPEDR